MKRIIVILALAASFLAAWSCDKYEDGRPSKDIRNEFQRMYPDAWDVEWEYQGSRWEVSFETGKRPEGKEHTAWYDASGGWIMTETEVFLSEVPQQIKAYLAESEYGSAQFTDNDAEYIMTPAGNYYRFDVRDGKDQFEVDVNEDGQVSLAAYGF